MNPADVPFLSGSELAAAIRNRKISASAALEAMIDRVERFNKPLNAVIVKDYKRARSRARAIGDLCNDDKERDYHGGINVPQTKTVCKNCCLNCF